MRKVKPPNPVNRILATWLIDELEQYKLGNVTESSIVQSLKEALHAIKAENI